MTTPAFPFLYKNRGTLLLESFTKAGGAYIAFQKAPTKRQLEQIVARCPAPIRGSVGATDTLFSIESWGDTFDWEMLEHYGTAADKAASMKSNHAAFDQDAADRFSADVDKWANAAHAIAPITFFIGPAAGDGEDPWDAYTRGALASVMVPFLEDYVARNAKKLAADDLGPGEVGRLGATHIACILQELDEDMGITIDKALVPRIEKLKKAYPL
jgi:hypothetical protein